ncbi:MAG: inositol monophosphatase [Anaerolineae bacterium]|nr:inositol monophosphatase [Anaerolineae bacterium]
MSSIVDAAQVKVWAEQTGKIALGHFNNIEASFKADHTFVTQADREIETFLSERIQSAYPNHALIGEEGARSGSQDAEVLWAIDPIDGTRAFVQGLPCWGVSIGVLHRGRPHFGLFYMPLLDDCTYIDNAGDVICNGHRLFETLRSEWDDQSFLAISSSTHWSYQIDVKRTRALGTLAANMVYTARGSALGAFCERAAIWDIAAGSAILQRLGAEITYLSGRAVDWVELLDGRQIPEPVVAAHPALLPRLLASIRRKT